MEEICKWNQRKYFGNKTLANMCLTLFRTCKFYEVSTVRTKYQQTNEIERNADSEPASREATF